MPGHKTHDMIGTLSIIPISGASLGLGYSLQTTIVLDIGILLGTYFLSPDLDLYSRIYRRWGILRFIWLPYQKLIKHRSWISHSGPLSGTIRFLYLLLWLLPLVYLTRDLHLFALYGILWIAIMIADSLHVIADRLWKDS